MPVVVVGVAVVRGHRPEGCGRPRVGTRGIPWRRGPLQFGEVQPIDQFIAARVGVHHMKQQVGHVLGRPPPADVEEGEGVPRS